MTCSMPNELLFLIDYIKYKKAILIYFRRVYTT